MDDFLVRMRGDTPKLIVADQVDFQVTEAGASNFFFVWKSKEGMLRLVTTALDDKIILDGITRRSVLELARERLVQGSKYLTSDVKDLEVVEKHYTMLEVEEASKEGRLVEVFLSGTAVSFATFNVP